MHRRSKSQPFTRATAFGRVIRSAGVAVASSIIAISMIGCAKPTQAGNPSFPITQEAAIERLKLLEASPKTMDRPLVILGGFMDWGWGPYFYTRQLDRHIDAKIIRITFADCWTFEQCRRRVVQTLDEKLGVVCPNQTADVDVIGQSMGGLIALVSAIDDPKLGKRMKIRRLFTLSSPLQGAKLAMKTSFNVFGVQAAMRPGSDLYKRLAAETFDFPIYSYTRLGDRTVGEQYASLPGRGVWWVENVWGQRAHVGVFSDKRILLDIVLRLRNETPVTTSPPVPLPTTKPAEMRVKQ